VPEWDWREVGLTIGRREARGWNRVAQERKNPAAVHATGFATMRGGAQSAAGTIR
jgi:hypothetical protein